MTKQEENWELYTLVGVPWKDCNELSDEDRQKARRNPKLFFGVSTNTLYPVSPLTLILPTYYK